MESENFRAGNPLRCEFGIWQSNSHTGKPEYRCRLTGKGVCKAYHTGRYVPCEGYPNQVCGNYIRQPRPKPIPGYEDLVKND